MSFLEQSVRYDAWDIACKKPFGAVSTGTEITIRLHVVKSERPRRAYIILRKDGVKDMTITVDKFYSNVTYPDPMRKILFSQVASSFHSTTYEVKFSVEEAGLYFYRFEVETQKGTLFVGSDKNARAVVGDFLPEWQLTVYRDDFRTPQFLQTGIMYQIFPDRFLPRQPGAPPADPLPPDHPQILG